MAQISRRTVLGTTALAADWQDAQWGSNYPKLLRTKRRYDPANFFRVHHGVGSEER